MYSSSSFLNASISESSRLAPSLSFFANSGSFELKNSNHPSLKDWISLFYTSSRYPSFAANKIETWLATVKGLYWACFNTSVSFWPFRSCFLVVASKSDANWANASNSLNWARSSLNLPATFLIALVCAAPPTRDTEIPALIAGLIPALNNEDSRKIWPSVIEITLVGI